MGSVEAFPRKPGVSTIADVWRITPVPGAGAVRVREMRSDDYAAIHALQRRAHPDLPAWTLKQLESRRHAFPEGQLVAEVNGELAAAACSLILRWDDYAVEKDCRALTADGLFTTHDPSGLTLYGEEMVFDAARRGFGIGRALIQNRRRICRRRNLRRIITPARLPGYHARKEELSPERYAMQVIWGDITEPALRFQMAQGFQYCGILHDFRPEDLESAGHAALLVWLNPLFTPARPPALAEPDRQRKCA